VKLGQVGGLQTKPGTAAVLRSYQRYGRRADVRIRRRVWGVIRPGGTSHQASKVGYDRRVLRGLILAVACAAAVAATASAATAKTVLFKTPSGNIGCEYSTGPDYLRCDIGSGLKPRPPQPQDCQEDYGDSVSMNKTGRPHYVCHGDTTRDPRAKAVAYGTTITVGPFKCTSKITGLTCRNASGHGWFLSRQSYRLF
jgi:hypothetical protein